MLPLDDLMVSEPPRKFNLHENLQEPKKIIIEKANKK